MTALTGPFRVNSRIDSSSTSRFTPSSFHFGAAVFAALLAGSQAAKDTVPSIHRYMATLRDSLIERGIIVPDGDFFKMSQDYTFDSPSTAAGVLMGRTANGRTEWKGDDGRTLKEIQSAAVDGQLEQ